MLAQRKTMSWVALNSDVML